MNFFVENGVSTLSFNALSTVSIALIMLLVGNVLKKRVKFFQKYCIPEPVIGGVLFAVINLVMHETGIFYIKLDTAYQADMQNIFFTCVGFSISILILKNGGKQLIKFIIMTTFLVIIQGIVGIGVARLVNTDQIMGLLAGPAALAGGHGNAAAYGDILFDMGYSSAIEVGMAAATVGLIAGSFFGAPLGERLITKNNLINSRLESQSLDDSNFDKHKDSESQQNQSNISLMSVFAHVGLITLLVGIGIWFQTTIKDLFGINLPTFVGAALLAFVINNINKKENKLKLNENIITFIQDFSLGVFLSIAMVSLRLWELKDLAIPLVIMLVVGILVTLLFIYFIVFRVLGKDYDSALMCVGLAGFGMGATPNGLANLDSISQVHGSSRIAYLSVIVTGGLVADWILMLVNTTIVNLFA